MKRLLSLFILVLLSSEFAMAQGQVRTQNNWRRSTAIVLFAGIGGGILGLSTLSFYGEPREHTGNITTGAFLGVLAGAGYIFYENNPMREPPRKRYDYFGLFQPTEKIQRPTIASVPTIQFEFTF